MDWQGQKLAEQIMQYSLISAALLAFLVGYLVSSFRLMLIIYAASVFITLLIIVPDWSYFNRHPLDWAEADAQSGKAQKAKPQATAKKPGKSVRK